LSTVAVVVPCYNGARYVEDAIRSVWTQTRPPQELLVVDDASTDDTAAVVRRLAAASPVPIRVTVLPENSGSPARPINEGLRAASADLIAVLDQDDALLPTHLASLAGVLEDQPDVTFAACGCAAWSSPGRAGHRVQSSATLRALRSAARVQPASWRLSGRDMLRVLVTRGNFLVGYPAFAFRRADWAAKGGLDESYRVGSDYEFLCWLCGRGDVVFDPRRLYRRRTHAANLSWVSGMRGMLDVGRVVLAYAKQANGAAASRDFWRLIGRHYVRMLITLGWADRHGDAFRRLARATSAWGWTPDTHMTAAKLAYTWLAPRLLGRTFDAPADQLDDYIACLDRVRALCDQGIACGNGG
jgi:glycosyltransferase involved in cell wall biosynthesis